MKKKPIQMEKLETCDFKLHFSLILGKSVTKTGLLASLAYKIFLANLYQTLVRIFKITQLFGKSVTKIHPTCVL